jgi:hypothetical protein
MIIYPEEENAILRQTGNLKEFRRKNEIRKAYRNGTVIPPSLKMAGGRTSVVESAVGWGNIAINAVNERVSLQGFVSEDDDNPYDINTIAAENGLETGFSGGSRDAFTYGTSFFTIGNGQSFLDPNVVISAHDPSYATADYSLRSRVVTSGVTVFPEDPDRGELITPESIVPFGIHQGRVFIDGERVDHGLGRCPMVQLINAADSGSTKGHSVLSVPMMKQIDFIIRTMDSIELNRELFAWGQRYLVTDRQFIDSDGNPIDPFLAAMTAMWKIPMNGDGTAPQVGTLPSNSPADLLALLDKWAQMFAAEASLPEYYFGVSPDANPTSADAIRAGEARLIKKANFATRQFTRPATEIAMLAILVRDGELPEDFTPPQPLWGDVTTIAPGAAADRALKLVSQGILQPTSRIVLTELGYTKTQQDIIMRENNAATGGMLQKLLNTEAEVAPTSVPAGNEGE